MKQFCLLLWLSLVAPFAPLTGLPLSEPGTPRSLSQERNDQPAGFVPAGYRVFDELYGDLNGDGTEDCVLIIKGTDSGNVVKDEYRGTLDRNRRGIIVLFRKNGQFEVAAKNERCFSSEQEDGGVYFPPELYIEIRDGKLYIHYAHGRYGFWKYTFRYNPAASLFELIGYDASHSNGPVIHRETSINFLTRKKLERVNTNEQADSGEEVFGESWHSIRVPRLTSLTEIGDFDELEMDY